MKKLVILFVSCILLMGCPPSSTDEYKPMIPLTKIGNNYVFPIANDSILLRCFYFRSFISKPKENLIVAVESKNRNIFDYEIKIQSKKNGNFKTHKEGNKMIFHINDSITNKKIHIKKDTISIIINEKNEILFSY